MLSRPIQRHQKTLSLPIFKNNSIFTIKNVQKKAIISNKSQIVLPFIQQSNNDLENRNNKHKKQKITNLSERLQKAINDIWPQKIYNQQIYKLNQETDQYIKDITEAKRILQLIHKIKQIFNLYNQQQSRVYHHEQKKYNKNNIFQKKIEKEIESLKQKQLVRYLWQKQIKINDKKLIFLINKYPTFFKDLNYVLNFAKNILSEFKIRRFSKKQVNIKRIKQDINKSAFKIASKFHSCGSQVRKTIAQTVSIIDTDCPSNKQIYRQQKIKAQNQLKSRKIICQLLQHEIYFN